MRTTSLRFLLMVPCLAVTLAQLVTAVDAARADVRFEEVARRSGLTYSGETWGAAWGDFNGDGWPDIWVGHHASLPSLYVNQQDGTFLDVAPQLPNYDRVDRHTAAWADFDNDGDDDLLEVRGWGYSNRLFINQGASFVMDVKGLSYSLGRGRGPLWFDWNHDGLLDVLIMTAQSSDGRYPTALFEQGEESFADVSITAGFDAPGGSNFAHIVDLDPGDDLSELFIHGGPYPQRIYSVTRTALEDISDSVEFPTIPAVSDVVIGDWNNDLLLDFFFATRNRDRGIERVSANCFNTRLISIGEEVGVSFRTRGAVSFDFNPLGAVHSTDFFVGVGGAAPASISFALSSADTDVVGIAPHEPGLDKGIFIGFDPSTETWTILQSSPDSWGVNAVVCGEAEIPFVGAIGFDAAEPQPGNRLLIQKANGFEDVTIASGLSGSLGCHGAASGDFDNDMDQDLYVACLGDVTNAANVLFENQGDGTFVPVADAGGAMGTADGRADGVAAADYDRDGFLDLLVTNGHGAAPFSYGPQELFHNLGNANHWLEIDLEGVFSNRDGIGSTVTVRAGGISQVRFQGGGTHGRSQDFRLLHFGLGPNAMADVVEVEWPSGRRIVLYGVRGDRILRVLEAVACGDGADSDGDGLSNGMDNCPCAANPGQEDADLDGFGNACDDDDDDDGLLDVVETNTGVFVSATDTGTDPLTADSDGDGRGDGAEVAAGSDPNNGLSPPPVPIPALPLIDLGLLTLGLLAAGRNLLTRRARTRT